MCKLEILAKLRLRVSIRNKAKRGQQRDGKFFSSSSIIHKEDTKEINV